MKAFVLVVSLLFVLNNLPVQAQEETDYTQFPENTYWVNVEYKLAPATFKDKVLVVLFWDMQDPIGKMCCHKLEDLNKTAQHMQLVSIVSGSSEHPTALSDLKAFVQDNSIAHPFGIAGDLMPFADVKGESLPKIFVYTKSSTQPTIYTINGSRNVEEALFDLKETLYNRDITKDYSYWQMKPSIDPHEYGMPLIAFPSFMASNEINKTFYIAENSQNRISGYSASGTLKDLIGGEPGDKKGNFNSAQFGLISGMEFDVRTELLYFIDASANKIKAADFSSEVVFDIEVTEQREVPRQYVDITFRDTSMLVLNAFPASLIEYGIKSKTKISEVIIQEDLVLNERVCKVSKGQKVIYVLTTAGRVFTIKNDKVELFYSSENWDEAAFDLVEMKKGIYILLSRKNEVVRIDKGKTKVVFSTPMGDSNIFDEVSEDFMRVSHSLCAFNGNLVLSDMGNNLIRSVNLKKKKAVKFKPQFSEQMAMSKDAVAGGEQVYFEQTILGNGTNQVEFVFELAGLKIYKEGRNELALEESGGIQLVEGGISDKGFSVRITPREDNNFAQMELYLTLYDPAVPEVIYFKRAVLNIEYEVIPGEETSHSMFYRPNIKAY
jgi:hypothetical protein